MAIHTLQIMARTSRLRLVSQSPSRILSYTPKKPSMLTCGRSGNSSTRAYAGVSKDNEDNVSPATRQENAKEEEFSDKKRET